MLRTFSNILHFSVKQSLFQHCLSLLSSHLLFLHFHLLHYLCCQHENCCVFVFSILLLFSVVLTVFYQRSKVPPYVPRCRYITYFQQYLEVQSAVSLFSGVKCLSIYIIIPLSVSIHFEHFWEKQQNQWWHAGTKIEIKKELLPTEKKEKRRREQKT